MSVLVRLDLDVKRRAEARAKSLGYTSLAALLRVLASQLAARSDSFELKLPAPTSISVKPAPKRVAKPKYGPHTPGGYQAMLDEKREGLPAPEKVVSTHPHIHPEVVYYRDPDFYRFCLEIGTFEARE